MFILSREGNVGAVKELLRAGAVVDAVTDRGCTPLYAASQNGHLDVVLLLLAAGAAVNSSDPHDGWTALHAAGDGGHEAVWRALVARGANVDALSKSGEKPQLEVFAHCASSESSSVRPPARTASPVAANYWAIRGRG